MLHVPKVSMYLQASITEELLLQLATHDLLFFFISLNQRVLTHPLSFVWYVSLFPALSRLTTSKKKNRPWADLRLPKAEWIKNTWKHIEQLILGIETSYRQLVCKETAISHIQEEIKRNKDLYSLFSKSQRRKNMRSKLGWGSGHCREQSWG